MVPRPHRYGSDKSLLHIRNTEDVPKGPISDLIPGSGSLTLKPGEYGQNPITPVPNTEFAVLSYQSSDDEVAMVDDVGVIHAISPGTCLIKVTEEDSNVEKTFPVVVEDNSKEVAGLKAKLTEYVTSASRDLATGKYTAETVKALKQKIAEANTVLDDTAATVRDIDIAQVRLLRAWRLLEPIDQTAEEEARAAEEADRILHEEINGLTKELINIYEKVDPAVYTTASYKTLSAAIAKAEQLLADNTSTAKQFREARTKLLKARKVLKKKSANTLKVKGKTVKLKAKKLKKKSQTVKRAKALTVSKPCGKVKYTLASVSKAKFKKYFKVNAKTGKITVKKRLKKGKYKVKIKVSAAGNGNYLPAAKTVKVIVKVK